MGQKNDQYYWQTEGLFLCRLTELVHKNSFEVSRWLNWTKVSPKVNPKVKPRPEYRERKTLPKSPLRNEIFMDDEDVEMVL